MSFFVILKKDAELLEQEVLAAAKIGIQYIEKVFVQDVEPALAVAFSAAVDIVTRNGGALLLTAAEDAIGALSGTGATLETVVAQILTAAKAAGAATIAAEEQLAARTALQLAQAVKATVGA